MLPLLKKMSIENNKSGKTLGQMLAAGELDATLGTSLPEEIRTNPDIVRLFPNYVDVDKDLWKRKGIYPIMHTVAIKKSVYERYPFVATSLYDAFVKSKKIALQKLFNLRAVRYMTPFLMREIDDIWEVVQRRSVALWRRAAPPDHRGAYHLSADARSDGQRRQGGRPFCADLRLMRLRRMPFLQVSAERTIMSQLEDLLRDLVIANRILSNEDVVDAYGHISVRHPDNPKRFFMSRSRAPELVERHDLIEFDQEGEPIKDKRQPYLERFIHAAIFESRPDIMAVVHAHAEDTLPFGLIGKPLEPVIHSGSFIGGKVPVWDIRKKFGDTDLLVRNMAQGRDLAKSPGQGQRGADARPRFCLGGALDHRGGAAVGLSAAQCARADERHAHGRQTEAVVQGRNCRAWRGLHAVFAGNLACLGILGDPRRLRRHDRRAAKHEH